MAMQYAEFVKLISPDGTTKVRLYAREGKRGYHLGMTMKKLGSPERAVTGLQDTVATKEEAELALKKMAEIAAQKGWLSRDAATGGRRFTGQLPTAPGFQEVADAMETSVAEAKQEIAAKGDGSDGKGKGEGAEAEGQQHQTGGRRHQQRGGGKSEEAGA